MTTLQVEHEESVSVTPDTLPVGRVEYARVGDVVYGIDEAGNVFRFELVVDDDDFTPLARFARSILRRPGRRRPRYARTGD